MQFFAYVMLNNWRPQTASILQNCTCASLHVPIFNWITAKAWFDVFLHSLVNVFYVDPIRIADQMLRSSVFPSSHIIPNNAQRGRITYRF